MESAADAGSTFAFDGKLEIVAGPHKQAAGPALYTCSRPLGIVLAEDNPVNQLIATRALNQRGHQVRVVSIGLDAIQAWEAEPFDVILIDNQMPEMGSVAAVERIRQRELVLNKPRTGIVALTVSAFGGRSRTLSFRGHGWLPHQAVSPQGTGFDYRPGSGGGDGCGSVAVPALLKLR